MLRIIFSVLFLVIGSSATVFAQDGQEQMENSVVKADAAFGEGRFLEAAEGYAEAFLFYKDYTLKKNEMVAWFKNGSCSPALAAGEIYLEHSENITKSDLVDLKSIRVRCELVSAKKSLNLGNIESCESHLDTAEKIISADSIPPVQTSDEYEEILKIRIEIEVLKKGEADPIAPIAEPKANYFGPILVGTGTAISATGIVLILLSLSAETDLQCTKNIATPSGCENPKEITKQAYESELEGITTMNTIGWISTLVGVTTMGVGSILWLSEGSVSASIDPIEGRFSASVVTHF